MPFEILKSEAQGPGLVADRALCLTADLSTVVEDGDPRSAFVLCGLGGMIPASEVARLDLHVHDGRVMQGPAEQRRQPEEAAVAEETAPKVRGRKQKQQG